MYKESSFSYSSWSYCQYRCVVTLEVNSYRYSAGGNKVVDYIEQTMASQLSSDAVVIHPEDAQS